MIETFAAPSTPLLSGVGKEWITNRIADAIKNMSLLSVPISLE
jgi:hypothetical protein